MRIENDRKLDFDDVLIRPKRSRLETRAEVELKRTFRLPHAGFEITGIPIIAANMDTVGTLKMAGALAQHNMYTSIHKHYDLDDLKQADLSGDLMRQAVTNLNTGDLRDVVTYIANELQSPARDAIESKPSGASTNEP